MAPSSALVSKIKVQLKLSISRLRMVQQKDEAIAKQQRRAMAQLLEQGKSASALIRTENIIRSDLTSELHEILELYCELLLARAGLLEAPQCDPGLEEAVKSIIHAAPRTEIKELQAARQLLVEKYGKEFAMEAMENPGGKGGVPEKVASRLRVEPPDEELVKRYLGEIARTYGVRWPGGQSEDTAEGKSGGEDDDDPSTGEKEELKEGNNKTTLEEPLATEELSKATPPRDVGGPKSPVHVAPPAPRTDNVSPRVKLPGPPELKPGSKMADAAKKGGGGGLGGSGEAGSKKASGAGAPGKVPDIDDLAKRFAALKK